MTEQPVLSSDNLYAYFYEHVSGAREQIGTELDEHTEFYLVNLLVEFLRTCNLLESGGRRVDEEPVAIRLLGAQLAAPVERYRELKHLADTTLYVLGWFAESLARSTVDRSYYASMAGGAYQRLSTLPASPRKSFEDPVFRELALKFEEVVGVIAAVREQSLLARGDVIQLYEKWLQTGSPRLAARLRELGVVISSRPARDTNIIH